MTWRLVVFCFLHVKYPSVFSESLYLRFVLTSKVILQIHFRQEHNLCEDETCLAKKFVVFATEFELKVTSLLTQICLRSSFVLNIFRFLIFIFIRNYCLT